MASILKVTVTRKLPPKPDIVSRKGEKFLRKKRGGRVVMLPITECGTKYREESKKWYVQYNDANGVKRRVPGYTDREATLQLAAKLERKAEQIQSGLADPHENGKLELLTNHLKDFRAHLEGESNSKKHVAQTCTRINNIIEGCKFSQWIDVVASEVVKWLAAERDAGKIGIKTSNYYLKAFKQFCSWLESDGRVPRKKNPVEHLSAINSDIDVRWERRAMTAEEFARLVEAANSGPDIQCVSGPDRAMLYILAAWTGYRRGELASLTLKSFNFESAPATVKVKASYSKRRRNDIVPLHNAVVEQLKSWLNAKGKIEPSDFLFNLKTSGDGLRRTAKMMRLDLERARATWIKESINDGERKQREESDFLCYQDEDGMYADFHSNRHLFITSLAKAGIHPKLAQSMARHSDVNITMGVYSHVNVAEQATAINTLPAPPLMSRASQATEKGKTNNTRRDKPQSNSDDEDESVAPIVAPTFDFDCPCSTLDDNKCPQDDSYCSLRKPLPQKELVALCRALASGDSSSGGRSRTYDTRIMIPLAEFQVA